MMTTAEIAKFLTTINLDTRAARHIRATVYRTHTGRWPTWRAHAMRRVTGAIVEIAEVVRASRGKRYAVIVWSLNKVRMVMYPRDTLAEARVVAACMFRIDGQRDALERGGLRPF